MIRTQIVLGILMMIATVATMAWIGATEDQRMATATDAQLARSIENGAYLYHNNCERCHGEFAEGIQGLCPPLNNLQLLEQRADATGWTGSLHGWLVSTIRGGRLISTRPEQYVGSTPDGVMAMPFWSQDFGGPLRNDQIEDIANFLENMPDEEYVDPATGPTPTPIVIDPSDPEAIIAAGVPAYRGAGCIGCHVLSVADAAGVVGPTHEGMATTAAERIASPDYTGEATTPEEYIRESIINTNVYVAPGYSPGIMPGTYSETLPEDQLEAIVQLLLLQE